MQPLSNAIVNRSRNKSDKEPNVRKKTPRRRFWNSYQVSIQSFKYIRVVSGSEVDTNWTAKEIRSLLSKFWNFKSSEEGAFGEFQKPFIGVDV